METENANFLKYVADTKVIIENLKEAINQDKTGLAKGLETVYNLAKSYDWIKDGRGPYAFDDERYKGEVLNMINEIQEVSLKALHESGVLANKAFGGIFEPIESQHSYSEQEIISMLEALRQSILDLEILREVNTNKIEEIDIHQFIPPLTK